MKRLLTSAALFLCCMATSFAEFSGSGSGTESDPYLIFNPIQLNQMRNFLGQSGVYFKLMANIDLTEFIEDEYGSQGWLPIGTSSSSFNGVLDGNGKTISGLIIYRPTTDNIGLFACANYTTIKDLTIVANIYGKDYVGGFVGGRKNSSTISNCTIRGYITGENYVGGFCGDLNGTLSYCRSSAKVHATGTCVGGIIGGDYWPSETKRTNLNNCFVSDGIVEGGDHVGGLAGFCNSITNSSYIGSVSGNTYVGGLAGSNWNITNSYFIGKVLATGDNVGGLVGYCGSTCYDSYCCGFVRGKTNVGGLVGNIEYPSKISRCYSNSTIIGEKRVGGIFGYGLGCYITKNVFMGPSIKATIDDVGRVYGYYKTDYGRIGELGTSDENKTYNKAIVIKAGASQEITDDEQNGAGVSATTLRLKATYVAMGWDFTDLWAIQETECYPYFKSQTAPPVITSQVVSGVTNVSGKCIDGGTITLEIDGVKQQMVSTGNTFSFTVSPLQAGHEVRVSAKADDKEQSYYTTEIVSYLGTGTEADPYQVYTAADLTGVYRKGYFKLMNDIDLTSYINQFSPIEGWESIGREGSETIHFDGNGHKITGLWCNSTRDNTGLFSCFANGNIKDLTVETAAGKQVKGGANTGILIGKMINGTIENCKVTGAVADGTPVGGMVGLFDGGEILKCQASVTINTTASTTYAGGLVGEITGGDIDQCYTDGSLTATGNESYAGGLVGKNSGTITNCYSSAAVASSYNAAGLVAYNFGVVDKCMASGNLYSNNYAAGIIGYNDGAAAVISNSVALNNIIDVTYESQQTQQGGGYGQRIIGGIKNGAPAPEMNNYALSTMQVSVNDVPQIVYNDIMNGTTKTDAELKQEATYQTIEWDFDNVWNIDEGASYPYQTIQMNNGSGPNDPNDPDGPDNPDEPQGKVDVTDVSQIANVIYIEPREETKGTEVTVPILMKNTAAIRGFQFDLYLPEGVTVAKMANNRFMASLSNGRKPEGSVHTLTVSEQEDGAIRFLCGSQYDETFTGTEGEIATIKLVLADDMAEGSYPIVLKNVKLTETNISNYYLTETVQTALNVVSYTPGDINGDGIIDVSDYIGVANYILGEEQVGIVAAAADVNKDQVVDVSDYIGVANLILYNNIYGQAVNAARSAERRRVNTDVSTLDNVIYISPLEAASNGETQVSIRMKNTVGIRGFQFDLYLPDGMTAVKDGNNRFVSSLSNGRKPAGDQHTLTLSKQPDGAIRFLCGSQYDETFTGNDGEIATLTINIDAGVAVGDYPVYLRNMKLTETDISKFYTTDEVETTVTVTGAADGRVVLDETSTTAPDVANGVNVRVKRTINAGEWSTICLPFAMSQAQCQAAFGSDVEIGDFTGYTYNSDEDKITVNFSSVTAIAANRPYIIKVSAAVTEFTVDGVDVNPVDDPRVSFRTGNKKLKDFVGTYVADFDFYNEAKHTPLFLSGNRFWYATETTKHMKAFRAYFDFVDMLSEVDAARVAIAFDEATVINDVRTCSDDRYYNLSGQQVETPTKGVYVKRSAEGRLQGKNGKKIIVK